MDQVSLFYTLEEIQARLSGGVALVDILATAMEYSPDEPITEALYAAARYLRDTSSQLTGVIEEVRGQKDVSGSD